MVITLELYVNYILFCVLYFYGQKNTVPSCICSVINCFYSTGVDVKKNVIVAITSDKGLCGGINSTSVKVSRALHKLTSGNLFSWFTYCCDSNLIASHASQTQTKLVQKSELFCDGISLCS
jgi:hypothetical protein